MFNKWIQLELQSSNSATMHVQVGSALCSPVPVFPEPMFTGTYVPRYLCSPVPMFPDVCTLMVDLHKPLGNLFPR